MDICASTWTEADAANSAAAPDGAPEGMAPSGVNDVLRAHQGALKRWYNWTVPKLTGGSATAYTLGYGVAPGALVDGMSHVVQFHAANGAAATLSVNGLGALPIQYYAAGAWRSLPPNLFGQDWIAPLAYNASAGAYRLIGFDNRTGAIEDDGGAAAPTGALLAYGQTVSRTTYAGLFARFGTTYNTGGEAGTDFRLPDLRDRVTMGKGDMGGSDAGLVSGGTTLGNAIGAATSAASVTVTGSTSGSLVVAKGGPFADAAGNTGTNMLYDQSNLATSGSLLVSASGTSGPFGIVQPTRVMNKVVRI